MLVISNIEGLIFPGIMDEPGATAGRLISFSPVLGPEERRRRSLQILLSSNDRFLNDEDRIEIDRLLCIDSRRSFELVTLILVIVLRFFITVFE